MAGAAESRSRGSGSREGRADPREEVEPTRESAPGPLSVSTGSAPHQRHNRTSSSSSTTTTKPSTSTPQTDDRLPVPTRSGLPTITKPPLFAPRSSSRQAFDSTQATPPLHFDHGRSNSTGRPGRNPYPSYNPFFSNLWDLPPRPSGPTSLPPPPRSPAGSIGRRRAEDLRRAGQVSDLELPGSSGAATSRTSRAGSIGRKQESATGLASFGETITGAVATSDKRTGPAEAPLGSHQVSRSQQPRQHHVPRLPPSHLPALARKPGSILRDSYRVPNDASTVEVQAAQDRSRSSRLRYAAPPIVEQRKQDRDSGLFSSAPRLSVHGDLEQDDITPSGVQPGPSPSRTTRATKGRRSSLLLSFSSSGSSTPETTNPKRFSSILRPSRPIKTAEQPSTEPRSDLEEQQSQFKHSKRNSFVERSLALLTPRKSKIRQRQDARAESAQQSSESNAAAVEEIRSAAAAEPGVGEPRTDEPLEHKLPSSDPISVSRIPIAPRPQSALGSTSAESRRADQSTAAADISGSLIPSRVDSNTKPVRPSTASAAMPTAQSAATIGTAAPSRRMSVSDNAGSRFTQHTWTGPGRATLSNAPSTRSRVDSASASSPPSSAGAALALASSTSAGGTGPRSGIPRPVRSPEQPSSSPEISHKPLPRAPATNRASILDHTHATNASLNLRLADPQRGIIGVAANEEVEPELSGFPKKQCAAGSESGASGRKVGGLDEVVRNAEGESAKDQRKETTERILPEQRRRSFTRLRGQSISHDSSDGGRPFVPSTPSRSSTLQGLRKLIRGPGSRSKSNSISALPRPRAQPDGLAREPAALPVSEFGELKESPMKSTSVGAKPQARESQRGVRGSQFFSPFRARETSKDKGKDRPGSDAEGAHSDSRQTSAPSADDSALADSSTAWGISTSVSLPSASGSRGPPTYFRSPSNGFIQVISATGDSTGASTPEMRSSPPATPSRSRDGPPRSGSVTPSGHFGSFHTSNRSLTLQALSAAHTTPLGVRNRSGVASPGSGPCVPGEYPDRQTEDDGAVSSSRRPSVLEEGMGIALGSDADAAERNIGTGLESRERPRSPLAKNSEAEVDEAETSQALDSTEPPMWRGELVPKISGLSVGSGDMPASRFDTSTTASFVTAPSVQSSSSPRRPQVVLSPRPSLPPLATRTQSSLDIPTRPSGSPLSELINGLKRHGTLHGTGESSNSDAETMAHYDNRPTIAAGPLPPVRFPTSSTTHHGTSSRRSYEHDLELPPSPSPSSGQKRRNTFGGGEAGAEQAWRGEDMSLSTSPRYGRAATASDSAARSPASGAAVALGSAMVGDLTVSEIEGHLEAVEAALHANSLNGGFDPDSLRRHMTSPERRRAVRLSMVANDGSYAEVPPPTSNAGEGNRVTLPPSSQAAIAAAVKQVRRALSSTQLQRNAQQPEFLEDNEPLPFEDQHESFARSPEHVARRDVTPMRAARIRQESMRDVELAYERMRELVQSAAAIAISPQRSPPSSRRRNALAAARHRAAASPDGRRERARSVASLPPSNSFGPEGLLLRSAVRGSKGHNRAQSALTVPPSSSLSGLMGMPSEREEESFRGRGAHASPRRAASSSPVKRNRLDEEQQAKSKVEAPQHSAQKRISVDASRSAGSGSAGDHTSPSTVAKTQGTPRSPHSDANEVVDESWDADRSPSLQTRSHHEKQPQQQHRRNAAGLSPVLGPSMERSPPSEVRPLALASAESARTIEDQRRRARAHLSATSTRAFQQRTPTPTLAAYRAHGDTSSTRDWASTRPSSSGDTRYASAQTSSKYLRRRSGPPEEQRSLEIEGRASSTASPTPQSVVALQRRHHLEKDSLLDSLARTQREIGDLRTANQELESDLRQEVTRTLQLERELVRRDEREADVGQRLARLEAQLAAERSERMLLAEQLAGLLGHADGHGGSLDESSIGVARGVDSARSSRNLHPVLGALISHSGSGSGSGSHGHLLSHNPPESPSLHSYPSVLGLQLGAGEADWENLMDEEPPPLTRQSSPMTLRTRADQSDTSLDSGLGDEADDDEDAQPAHVSRETAGGISRRSPHRSGTPSLLPIPTSSASNSISTAGGGMSSIVRRFPASLAINLANASGDRKISNATTGTTGGDSSFTAQTDSPVGSFIEAFGHHHGYYDPRRPQGYDPLAMDTKTEAALLESLDDAEPTPVASRFEHL